MKELIEKMPQFIITHLLVITNWQKKKEWAYNAYNDRVIEYCKMNNINYDELVLFAQNNQNLLTEIFHKFTF